MGQAAATSVADWRSRGVRSSYPLRAMSTRSHARGAARRGRPPSVRRPTCALFVALITAWGHGGAAAAQNPDVVVVLDDGDARVLAARRLMVSEGCHVRLTLVDDSAIAGVLGPFRGVNVVVDVDESPDPTEVPFERVRSVSFGECPIGHATTPDPTPTTTETPHEVRLDSPAARAAVARRLLAAGECHLELAVDAGQRVAGAFQRFQGSSIVIVPEAGGDPVEVELATVTAVRFLSCARPPMPAPAPDASPTTREPPRRPTEPTDVTPEPLRVYRRPGEVSIRYLEGTVADASVWRLGVSFTARLGVHDRHQAPGEEQATLDGIHSLGAGAALDWTATSKHRVEVSWRAHWFGGAGDAGGAGGDFPFRYFAGRAAYGFPSS